MNTKVMFSSEKDSWSTPKYLYNELNDESGFNVDVCDYDENAKFEKFYSKEMDGLTLSWAERIRFHNPP